MPDTPSPGRTTASRGGRAALAKPFQVVVGKGGVGRTVVSCALALRSAAEGQRTLLLEVNTPDTAAHYLEVPPAVDEPHEVRKNLWLCRMTPAGSLREYALMVLRFKALYSLVFENRLVKYLLRSIPALAEFTMLGKAWFHSTQKLPDGQPRFERIILDAPATGHALTFLSVARTVADTVPNGVMRNAAERMAELIESRDRTCMHVVALPEEMPVNEGLELAVAGRERLRMTPGLAIMNRMLGPLLRPQDVPVFEALAQAPSPAVRPYVEAANRHRAWEQVHAEFAARFAAQSGLPLAVIPELNAERVDVAFLERVAALFDEVE